MEDPIELARRAMTERRLQAEKRMPAEDPYLAGVNYPAHGSFTPDLYFRLAIANRLLKAISANELVLTPSRLPLVHGLIDKIKWVFHDLVLNYVRRLALRQSELNANLVRVLNEVVAEAAVNRDKRLEDLERRIAALEASSAGAKDGPERPA